MHDVIIREATPDELDVVVGIMNATNPPDSHTTVERARSWQEMLSSDAHPLDLIAERNSTAVGAGSVRHGPYDPAGRFGMQIDVLLEARRQGLGHALYQRLRAHALAHGGTELAVMVHEDNLPLARTWLEREGFEEIERMRQAELDLRDLDAQGLAVVEDRARRQGVELVTLEECDVEACEQLYEVYLLSERDVPVVGERVDLERTVFDRQLASKRLLPDCTVIARQRGQVVGFTLLARLDDERAGTWMTGVHPGYRGQGIALAVKARCVLLARDRGFRALRTNNHVNNAPMLAVNRRLGYHPLPERVLYRLSLPGQR